MRTIALAGEDHSHLRRMIYDFARNELRRQLYHRLDFRFLEIKQQTSALESAIEQLESEIGDRPIPLPAFNRPTPLPAYDRDASARTIQPAVASQPRQILPANRTVHTYEGYPAVGSRDPNQKPRPIRTALWSTFQLFVAVILGVAAFSVVENRGTLPLHASNSPADNFVIRSQQLVSAEEPGVGPTSSLYTKQAQSNSSFGSKFNNFPIPSSYGVYAVDRGKLIDLQPFSIKVPDRRVEISAIFSTPSATTLADGRLQFVAFRRDLTNDAPDHVMIRVVAQVMRALTFDAAGTPKTVNIDSSWAVRSKAYEMKVSPVDGKPEMILIQPESAGFSLPPGRYALVLLGTSYDFTVAGQITDPAQCLERTDALNMPVYSECRNPDSGGRRQLREVAHPGDYPDGDN